MEVSTQWDDVERLVWRYITLTLWEQDGMAVDIGIQSTLRSSQATLTKILVNICTYKYILEPVPSETAVPTNINEIWDTGHSSRHLCPQVETWLLLTLGRWATTADGILEILSWRDSSPCVFHLLYLIHSCQRKSSHLLIASLVFGDSTSVKRQVKTFLHSLNVPSTAHWWQTTCSTMSCLLRYEIISHCHWLTYLTWSNHLHHPFDFTIFFCANMSFSLNRHAQETSAWGNVGGSKHRLQQPWSTYSLACCNCSVRWAPRSLARARIEKSLQPLKTCHLSVWDLRICLWF